MVDRISIMMIFLQQWRYNTCYNPLLLPFAAISHQWFICTQSFFFFRRNPKIKENHCFFCSNYTMIMRVNLSGPPKKFHSCLLLLRWRAASRRRRRRSVRRLVACREQIYTAKAKIVPLSFKRKEKKIIMGGEEMLLFTVKKRDICKRIFVWRHGYLVMLVRLSAWGHTVCCQTFCFAWISDHRIKQQKSLGNPSSLFFQLKYFQLQTLYTILKGSSPCYPSQD